MVRGMVAMLALAVLAACQTNDLGKPPVPLGDFALGLNVVVADNVQMVPLSRKATPDEWETALKKAVDDRFGRYQGTKLYNIGIAVEAFALAPPGVPVVLKPRSILVITANVWDDAAQKKLNPEGKQFHIFEKGSAETMVGSGLTQNRQRQMEILSYNAAKRIEQWFLDNPEWFGLPPKGTVSPVAASSAAVPAVASPSAAPPAVTQPAPALAPLAGTLPVPAE